MRNDKKLNLFESESIVFHDFTIEIAGKYTLGGVFFNFLDPKKEKALYSEESLI